MNFEKGHLYHIYNQGNNRQDIFFKSENYLYFLQKIRTHLLPYCDVLAWCLMPNHFHLMVRVNCLEVEFTASPGATLSRTRTDSLQKSIGILLASYTRAINKQEKRSGSLWRKETKAVCLTCPNGIAPSFYNTNAGALINIEQPEEQYPQQCYSYILNNPVKAGLVSRAIDWEYSSARDVTGWRKGSLINQDVIEEYGLVFPI
ncbi:transposase [Carboxylicivirga caseinilyticus]|uniref:transposase n=1 Tax=Carboxylicivirga caseinilyticus TaxID=3417572 RepID=UPI003D3592D8|nr:transposase [Marinilabiliaceae bacterium A049]